MIRFSHLSFFYWKADKKVLDDVDLQIETGQIVGVLGGNGAGKSTLLRLAAGLLRPTGGKIAMDGSAPAKCYPRLVFLSGEGTGFAHLTPRKQGEFLAGFYPGFEAERYRRLLARFGLEEVPLGRLPPGKRAEAELAAGLSKGAEVLIMDEPFLGMDPMARENLLTLMAQELLDGVTVLLATNQPDGMERFFHRAVTLRNGRIADDFLLESLLPRGETLTQRLISPPG